MTRPRPRKRLAEDIADQVTHHVISQNLQPGDRMPTETELAELFGVSRTVVREATRLLGDRGLVVVGPGRGMVVAEFEGDSLTRQYSLLLNLQKATFEQLMELRLVVEVGMTRYAAENRTERDLSRLESAIADFRGAGADQRRAVEADLSFHIAVAEATQNPFFSYMIGPINDYLRQTYLPSLGYDTFRDKTLAEHVEIAELISRSDPEAAADAAHRHLVRVVDDSSKLVDAGARESESIS